MENNKKLRDLAEVLETKKLMALDKSRSVNDWEDHQWFAAKAKAFDEAITALRTIEKGS